MKCFLKELKHTFEPPGGTEERREKGERNNKS
jgi:hypothetical protein